MIAEKRIFYADAPIADPSRHKFYLCWLDPDTEEAGLVRGEDGCEWAEVHEVSTHFNAEDNGLFYFVGDERANPLRPSYEEAHDIARFEVRYRYGLSPSERLALDLLFGGDHNA